MLHASANVNVLHGFKFLLQLSFKRYYVCIFILIVSDSFLNILKVKSITSKNSKNALIY